MPDWTARTPDYAAFLAAQDLPTLQDQLPGAPTDVQEAICGELGDREDASSARVLINALSTPSARVRAAAIEALWQIGAREAGPPILQLFLDRTQPVGVRDAAAYAIGRLGYIGAKPALERALPNENGTVAACVLGALAELEVLGHEAIQVVGTEAVRWVPSPELRRRADDIRLPAASAPFTAISLDVTWGNVSSAEQPR